MGSKAIIFGGLILCLLVVGLVVASGTLPWYKVTLTVILGSITTRGEFMLGLQGQTRMITTQHGDDEPVIQYNENDKWSDTSAFPSVKSVYQDCAILMLIGFIVFCVISLLLLIMLINPLRRVLRPCLGGSKGKFIVIALAFIGTAILGVGFLLLLKQPSAFQNDFKSYIDGLLSCGGACSQFMGSDNSWSWGPTTGWWLAIGATFVGLITVGLVASSRNRFEYQRI